MITMMAPCIIKCGRNKRKKKCIKIEKIKFPTNEIDRDIIRFWNTYLNGDMICRKKIIAKMPFENEKDRILADSFFEDIIFAMHHIKK